jgi:hypothetical protein
MRRLERRGLGGRERAGETWGTDVRCLGQMPTRRAIRQSRRLRGRGRAGRSSSVQNDPFPCLEDPFHKQADKRRLRTTKTTVVLSG